MENSKYGYGFCSLDCDCDVCNADYRDALSEENVIMTGCPDEMEDAYSENYKLGYGRSYGYPKAKEKSCKNCHYYDPDFNGSECCTFEIFTNPGRVKELPKEKVCDNFANQKENEVIKE